MKRIVIFMVGLLSLTLSAITPITQFTEGNYLGNGEWLSQDGSSGSFKSFTNFEEHGFTTAKFMLGDLHVHTTRVEIDPQGFLLATVIDVSDPLDPLYYFGYGNCGTSYCQMTIFLDYGTMQKAVIFNEDGSIKTVGALNFYDDSPKIQWESSSVPLP